MPRTRRYFRGNRPYEITLRVREGLPLPPWEVINTLIRSALARTQRDHKVALCHFVWMGNHVHMLVLIRDGEQAKKFYMELQRKITGYLKRLLGRSHLHLWEGEPSVAEILDGEELINRLVYFYCNPTRAHLESSIDLYPGLSTWSAMKQGVSRHTEEVPWIRFPAVEKLPAPRLSRQQDRFITAKLRSSAKTTHTLTVEPDAWCACFGITSEARIRELRACVITRVRAEEERLAKLRETESRRVIGAARLREAAITQAHTPSKRERRIFVLSSDRDLRISYIEALKELSARCRELYLLARQGVTSLKWPPGMFRPPLPPLATPIGRWE